MATSSQANPFAQHYLEISALDPAGAPANVPVPLETPGTIVFLPIALFFALFIGGFSVLFYKRMKNIRGVFMVFIFALLLGALPVALQSLSHPSDIGIKADPDLTPTNVIVTSVTPTGFVISWETSKLTSGALKIAEASDMQSGSSVYNDGNPKTYHRLVVLNLKPGQTYYLQVLADSQWFEYQGKPIAVTLPAK